MSTVRALRAFRRTATLPGRMDAADLMFAGVARQRELLRSGALSARELVQASLDRIAALDGRLNAFRVVLGEPAAAGMVWDGS